MSPGAGAQKWDATISGRNAWEMAQETPQEAKALPPTYNPAKHAVSCLCLQNLRQHNLSQEIRIGLREAREGDKKSDYRHRLDSRFFTGTTRTPPHAWGPTLRVLRGRCTPPPPPLPPLTPVLPCLGASTGPIAYRVGSVSYPGISLKIREISAAMMRHSSCSAYSISIYQAPLPLGPSLHEAKGGSQFMNGQCLGQPSLTWGFRI